MNYYALYVSILSSSKYYMFIYLFIYTSSIYYGFLYFSALSIGGLMFSNLKSIVYSLIGFALPFTVTLSMFLQNFFI